MLLFRYTWWKSSQIIPKAFQEYNNSIQKHFLYVLADFFIYSFKKDLTNHKVMLHVALGRLTTLDVNELQSEQYYVKIINFIISDYLLSKSLYNPWNSSSKLLTKYNTVTCWNVPYLRKNIFYIFLKTKAASAPLPLQIWGEWLI